MGVLCRCHRRRQHPRAQVRPLQRPLWQEVLEVVVVVVVVVGVVRQRQQPWGAEPHRHYHRRRQVVVVVARPPAPVRMGARVRCWRDVRQEQLLETATQ